MSDAASTGEVAGIISAIVVGLVAIGKGVQWAVSYFGTREQTRVTGREEKLERWHAELEAREKAFDARMDGEFAEMKAENRQRAAEGMALRMAFELVASALRALSPGHSALNRAEQILQSAFPLMPQVPSDMALDLQTIERMDLAATAAARRTGDSA